MVLFRNDRHLLPRKALFGKAVHVRKRNGIQLVERHSDRNGTCGERTEHHHVRKCLLFVRAELHVHVRVCVEVPAHARRFARRLAAVEHPASGSALRIHLHLHGTFVLFGDEVYIQKGLRRNDDFKFVKRVFRKPNLEHGARYILTRLHVTVAYLFKRCGEPRIFYNAAYFRGIRDAELVVVGACGKHGEGSCCRKNYIFEQRRLLHTHFCPPVPVAGMSLSLTGSVSAKPAPPSASCTSGFTIVPSGLWMRPSSSSSG